MGNLFKQASASLFAQESVATILSDFERLALRLEKHKENMLGQAATKRAEATELMKVAANAEAEGNTALGVAGNLRKLMTVSA